jgi:hypothetical protein
MEYEPKQPVYLPTADYLQLDLFLMETRPGVNPRCQNSCRSNRSEKMGAITGVRSGTVRTGIQR